MPSIGTMDKKTVSAVSLLDQREILSALVDIQNDAGLTDLMSITGRYKPTKVATYHSFTNEALYMLGDTTGATVTGTGTATIGTALTAGTSGFARKGDLVIFPTGAKVGLVTNVTGSPDALTIKSIDGTNITHTAAEKLGFFSDAYGEKSLAPANRRYTEVKTLNKIQTFRDVNEETDIQSMSTIELEFGGQNFIVYKDLIEKAIKIKGDINGALFGGQMSATSYEDASPAITDPVGGGAVQTTRGLHNYIVATGISDQVATLGTVVMADFKDLATQLIAKKAPKKYMGWCPSMAKAAVDDCLKGLNSSGVTSARLELDGKKDLDFQTDSLSYAGFRWQFVNLPILDHQEMFSQTDIAKSIYWVPEDKVKVVGGGEQPRIQVRFQKSLVKGTEVGSQYISEWHSGALAPTGPIGDELIWRTNFVSHQGLECLGVQHFAKTKVLA